jgi:Flp pilus assembly pilin Flp
MTTLLYMAAHKLRNDQRGQDLIEYALLAGFLAVAVGAIFPPLLMPTVSGIYSKLNGYLVLAGNQGS